MASGLPSRRGGELPPGRRALRAARQSRSTWHLTLAWAAGCLAACGRIGYDPQPIPDDGAVDEASLGDASVDAGGLDGGGPDGGGTDGGGTDAGGDPGGLYNVAFVTSTQQVVGNAGGLAGLDAICQSVAEGAGLEGTFLAWASTDAVYAPDRFSGARGWVRPDGKPFADRPDDLVVGHLFHPPLVTEEGRALLETEDARVAVGTDFIGGLRVHERHCANWADPTGEMYVHLGNPWRSSLMSTGAIEACSTPLRLFCLQVDRVVELRITPTSGRMAFASAFWAPEGGVAGADAHCQGEADGAGLTGSFLALLATGSASAASRFDAGGLPWVRPDGIPIAPTAADLLRGDIDAPIEITAGGGWTAGGNDRVWTGAPTVDELGTATCGDWSTIDAAVRALVGSTQAVGTDFFHSHGRECHYSNHRLYCLEE